MHASEADVKGLVGCDVPDVLEGKDIAGAMLRMYQSAAEAAAYVDMVDELVDHMDVGVYFRLHRGVRPRRSAVLDIPAGDNPPELVIVYRNP